MTIKALQIIICRYLLLIAFVITYVSVFKDLRDSLRTACSKRMKMLSWYAGMLTAAGGTNAVTFQMLKFSDVSDTAFLVSRTVPSVRLMEYKSFSSFMI